MVKLFGTFSQLAPKKILVAGDLLLDTYTFGKARRISPEAPVAIINVQKEDVRAGGAGNTLLNLISMGAEVSCLGRVGKDESGKKLISALKKENICTDGIIIDPSFSTPIKNRIVADNQQIVRVDHEIITPLPKELEQKAIQLLPSLLKDVEVIAISDYGKGFLTTPLLKALTKIAREKNIFIIADPKGTDFAKYGPVNLLKPNLSEAYAATHLPTYTPLNEVAEIIFRNAEAESLLITRSEDGISLFNKDGTQFDFPVIVKQVKDVTGAGDTVLAMLAVAIANKLSMSSAIQLSNIAAGIAIEQFGCARISLPQLAKRLLESDVSNKIFDLEHLHALQAALADTDCILIELSGLHPPEPELVAELAKEKKSSGRAILATINSDPISEVMVNMIASLQPIDFILLNTSQDQIRKYFPNIIPLSYV